MNRFDNLSQILASKINQTVQGLKTSTLSEAEIDERLRQIGAELGFNWGEETIDSMLQLGLNVVDIAKKLSEAEVFFDVEETLGIDAGGGEKLKKATNDFDGLQAEHPWMFHLR